MQLLLVTVTPNDSDMDIAEQISIMRNARTKETEIRCVIGGYDDDPRELWQIPEVQAFCQRLMQSGFVSHLNLGNAPGQPLFGGWGAAEVYLCSEGRLEATTEWTEELVEEVCQAWCKYNHVADSVPDDATNN